MPNEDLYEPLRRIHETIGDIREHVLELTREVKKTRKAIIEAADRIQDAIHDNIQAQAELKLMEYVMEVRTFKPQIEAEHEQIRTERDELDERLESIDERYAEKQRELDEKARDRVRNLGSHIFAIEEEEFEAGIERPFTEQVTRTWASLQQHNETVGDERKTTVHETTGETVQAVNDYINRQEHLLDQIDDHRLDSDSYALPADEMTTLQAPYYVVEYENDGVRSRQIVVPSQLSKSDSEWSSAALEPIDGAESLINGVAGVESPARTSRLTSDQLSDVLKEYGNQSALGLSYTDTIAKAVPDDGVQVALEVDD